MWLVTSNRLSQHAPVFYAARAEKRPLSQHAPVFAARHRESKLQMPDIQPCLQTAKCHFQYLISTAMLSQHAPVSPLTPKQRIKLEEILLIRYDSRHVETEPVFNQSILRGGSLLDFIVAQERIKELMHCTVNVRALLGKHKTQLNLFMSEIDD